MDVFDFAMQMELDGRKFYEEKAATAKNKDMKEILKTLAEEEEGHYRFFKRMKEGQTEDAASEIGMQSETLAKVKNIFVSMSEESSPHPFGDDVVAVWTEALRIEEKAVKFYSEKANAETDPRRKELILAIAEEEKNHVHMISGVLTYIKHPQTFADSAQFKNFQSWEGR